MSRATIGGRDPANPPEVVIITLPHASGASVFSAHDDLFAVGRRGDCAMLPAPDVHFRVRIAGDPVRCAKGIELRPEHALADTSPPDLVYVPALIAPPEQLIGDRVTPFDAHTLRWLHDCHAAGSTVASLCTGVTALAEAGLLDGLESACYAPLRQACTARYPAVHFVDRPLVVDGAGGRIVTAGDGIYHGDLMLYLIERFAGRRAMHAFAQMSGKFWVGDERNVHARLVDCRAHGDPAVERVQQILAENLAAPVTNQQLADQTGLSRRTLARRFREATGHSPVEYLQALRIELARTELESPAGAPVTEVAARVGYSDVSFFRRLFQRRTGLTPSEYRRRFRLPPIQAPDIRCQTAAGS